MTANPERCARYQVSTAGIADGEGSAVPWRARRHIRHCRACRSEVAAQRAVSRRLGEAAGAPRPLDTQRRRRTTRAWILAAGMGVAGVSVGAWLTIAAAHDPVPAALAAAAQPPSFRATDTTSVSRWCVTQAGVALPVLSLPPLQLEGARMDQIGGASAVTVYYTGSGGKRMTVTWVEMSSAQPGSIQVGARSIEGRTALVIHDNADTAVVTGDGQPADLWRTAGQLAGEL